mmetsp:Transcript_74151/g.199929  ORF Transcript_74151/g.199929 Transcript_74151/m.199929 type:complete len:257 (-) Transcript_74151:642-1412(-)
MSSASLQPLGWLTAERWNVGLKGSQDCKAPAELKVTKPPALKAVLQSRSLDLVPAWAARGSAHQQQVQGAQSPELCPRSGNPMLQTSCPKARDRLHSWPCSGHHLGLVESSYKRPQSPELCSLSETPMLQTSCPRPHDRALSCPCSVHHLGLAESSCRTRGRKPLQPRLWSTLHARRRRCVGPSSTMPVGSLEALAQLPRTTESSASGRASGRRPAEACSPGPPCEGVSPRKPGAPRTAPDSSTAHLGPGGRTPPS